MTEWTTNIQWKGTDLCMDFICPACGSQDHIDALFCYEIQCDACHAKFKMPTDIGPLLVRVDGEPMRGKEDSK